MQIIKRSVLFFWLLIWLFQPLVSQDYTFPSKVIKYFPAPGQHINDPNTGIPDKANELIQGINSGVSLGAFGGYIVFYFEEGIENHPENPYGVDFTVFGNSFSGSAEPGIVQVMKDENHNGLPDESWFEIAGSLHYTDLFVPDYAIRYYQPLNNLPGDILWTDSNLLNGTIVFNKFHEQSYYPNQEYFAEYPKDSVEFTANRLSIPVISEQGILKTGSYLFGYADNIQQNQGISLNLPDNPYTPDIIEGAGGNAIDISWALDNEGNYISLDRIHFIKIHSAVLANAGSLGEVSTEVTGVIDVPENHLLTGPMEVISMETIPNRIISGSGYLLDAILFKQGKQVLESLHWESDMPLVAEVIGDTLLKAKESGIINLTVSSKNNQIVNSKTIKVVKPDHIKVESDFDQMLQDKKYQIKAYVVDNEGCIINQISPILTAYDNTAIDIELTGNGNFTLTGLKPGNFVISFGLSSNSEINYDFNVQIVLIPDPVKVSFSMQLENTSLIERSWFTIEKQNSKLFIERGEDHSEFLSDPDINLCDVITQVLLNNGYSGEGNSFQYRIDEHSNGKLYFWQLGTNWEFHYGWGGTTETSFQSSWVACINDSVYFNDFNKLVIHEGDIINLSLVEDITHDWDELVLLPEKQEIEPGEEIQFEVQKYLYHPLRNQTIVSEANSSLEQNELFINGIPSGKLGQLFSEDGHSFSLYFEKDGVYHISVEGYEEYSLNIFSGTTGIIDKKIDQAEVTVYPNPCTEKIFVSANLRIPCHVKLLNMQAKVLIERDMKVPKEELDISHLAPGVYLIEIKNEEMACRQIIIKR
jgi:plastocyanin